jgi:hypothetical protein
MAGSVAGAVQAARRLRKCIRYRRGTVRPGPCRPRLLPHKVRLLSTPPLWIQNSTSTNLLVRSHIRTNKHKPTNCSNRIHARSFDNMTVELTALNTYFLYYLSYTRSGSAPSAEVFYPSPPEYIKTANIYLAAILAHSGGNVRTRTQHTQTVTHTHGPRVQLRQRGGQCLAGSSATVQHRGRLHPRGLPTPLPPPPRAPSHLPTSPERAPSPSLTSRKRTQSCKDALA